MNAPLEFARAVCPHDCPDTCAMRVSVKDGKAVKVVGDPDHPPTQGVLCTKVSRYPERVHHPARLTTPLKRVGKKGEGRFEPIGWDEALTLAASRQHKAAPAATGTNSKGIDAYGRYRRAAGRCIRYASPEFAAR